MLENFGQSYIDECNDWRNRRGESIIETIEAGLPQCNCGGNYIWTDEDFFTGKPLFSCDTCHKDYEE